MSLFRSWLSGQKKTFYTGLIDIKFKERPVLLGSEWTTSRVSRGRVSESACGTHIRRQWWKWGPITGPPSRPKVLNGRRKFWRLQRTRKNHRTLHEPQQKGCFNKKTNTGAERIPRPPPAPSLSWRCSTSLLPCPQCTPLLIISVRVGMSLFSPRYNDAQFCNK